MVFQIQENHKKKWIGLSANFREIGTKKDRVNCQFYFKIGSCRHGDCCSHLQNRTTISPHSFSPICTTIGNIWRRSKSISSIFMRIYLKNSARLARSRHSMFVTLHPTSQIFLSNNLGPAWEFYFHLFWSVLRVAVMGCWENRRLGVFFLTPVLSDLRNAHLQCSVNLGGSSNPPIWGVFAVSLFLF